MSKKWRNHQLFRYTTLSPKWRPRVGASGIFTNGRSTAQVEVELRLAAGGLEIRDRRDNLMLAQWAYADIATVRPLKPGQRLNKLRITCLSDSEERLTIDDPILIGQLQKATRALKPPRKPLPPWVRYVAMGMGILILFWLMLEALGVVAGPLARNLPGSWETAIGQRLSDHMIERLGGACHSGRGQAALDALAQRFDHDATRSQPLRLRAVKSSAINAFALPGNIIITEGMIKDVETADQLAAVIAHQLAHLDLHHSTAHLFHQAGIGMVLLTLIVTEPPFTNSAINDLQHLTHDRQEETEANALGQSLLQKADISVQSMVNYFRLQDLHEKTRGSPSDFLLAHPTVGKRLENRGVQPFSRPALTDQEWQSVQNICG
jgi:Zn-dependent protease with chaperone function